MHLGLILLDLEVEALHFDNAAVNQWFHFFKTLGKGIVADDFGHGGQALTNSVNRHEHFDYDALFDAAVRNDVDEIISISPVVHCLIEAEVESFAEVLFFSDAEGLFQVD